MKHREDAIERADHGSRVETTTTEECRRRAECRRAAIRFLHAIAASSRVKLCKLVEGEHSVGALAAFAALRQPNASRHLARMRREGFVSARREGSIVFYSIGDETMRRVLSVICHACRVPSGATTAGGG